MLESVMTSAAVEPSICGVVFKELKSFPDQRGFFREIVRFNDPFFDDHGAASGDGERAFGQWSHSKMAMNTVKAWHFHHQQIDWWYAPIGLIYVVLFDARKESPTYQQKVEFLLGEDDLDSRALTAIVRIPQGVLHGCKVMSDLAHLFYITSQTYNPDDEGRVPFNSSSVPHSWGDEEELIVAANDRREFQPRSERTAMAR